MADYAYWTSTALLAAMYLASATLYIFKKEWVHETLVDLKYPAPYLVPMMAVVKIIAPLAILTRLNVALSDLAYAGIFFHLILSGLAHLGVSKPKGAIPALAGLLLLAVSFTAQNFAREIPSPYSAAISAWQNITLI